LHLAVALADNLEQQIGPGLVDGQKAQLIEDQKGRSGIFFQLLFYYVWSSIVAANLLTIARVKIAASAS